jgi:transcriptional regulator with XRE-family HTH domain
LFLKTLTLVSKKIKMDVVNAHIGHKIKKLRELKNYTQSYMASELGITQGAYSRIEVGETEISYGKLSKISSILDVPVDDIVSFNENMIFNVSNNEVGNGYVVNNGITLQERKLYQDQIDLLKNQNEVLLRIIEKYLEKPAG